MAKDWGRPPWEIEKEEPTDWTIFVWQERYKAAAPLVKLKRQKEIAQLFGANTNGG
jgi:hypothetical protein